MVNHPFGWDYPPGVSSLPADEPVFCEVCKSSEDECICPMCSVCGDIGNPACYEAHMQLNEEQRRLRLVFDSEADE